MKKLGVALTGVGIGIGLIIMLAMVIMPKYKESFFAGGINNIQPPDFMLFVLTITDAVDHHIVWAACTCVAFILVGVNILRRPTPRRNPN